MLCLDFPGRGAWNQASRRSWLAHF